MKIEKVINGVQGFRSLHHSIVCLKFYKTWVLENMQAFFAPFYGDCRIFVHAMLLYGQFITFMQAYFTINDLVFPPCFLVVFSTRRNENSDQKLSVQKIIANLFLKTVLCWVVPKTIIVHHNNNFFLIFQKTIFCRILVIEIHLKASATIFSPIAWGK